MPKRKNTRRLETRSKPILRPLLRAFELVYPGFNLETRETRINLVHIIWQSVLRYRQHKSVMGGFWLTYQELEQRFGRAGFRALNKRLGMFKVSRNWYSLHGRTKRYELAPVVEFIKSEALRKKPRGRLATQLDLHGNIMRTPPGAVAAKDVNGVSAAVWAKEPVPNVVPVNLDALDALANHLDCLLDEPQRDFFIPANTESLRYRRDLLAQIIKLAHTEAAGRGNIAHRYKEATTGRLSAQDVNLQSAPRCIRKAALLGLWDYDIANCHYSILLQMAARYDCACPHIGTYLADKKGTREGIAEDVGIGVDDVKQILLALIYGAHATEWYEADIPRLIGKPKARTLYQHPLFNGIHEDVKTARDAILANWPVIGRSLFNIVGKYIGVNANTKERMAHLVQGVEVLMLRTALRLYPDKIVLLVHDGFVSTAPLDVARIEQAIHAETGYRMELEEGRISMSEDFDIEAE